MADQDKLDLPKGWDTTAHQEIETYGIGDGFALFDTPGQALRGICRTFFPTKHGRAVAIELTQPATVKVFKTSDDGTHEEVSTAGGTLVNVSLSGVDLGRKIRAELVDVEVGIQLTHTVPTKSGAMSVYRVLVFQYELPI